MKIAKTPAPLENLISPSVFLGKVFGVFFLLFVAELEKNQWLNGKTSPTNKLFFLQIFANQS